MIGRIQRWLAEAARDVRLAGRALRRTPGFTTIAVASLGLGLALTASTLSVVNAYLIRSMPFPSADRLYHVMYAATGQAEPGGMSALDWQALGDVVELFDASAPARFYIGEGADLQEAQGLAVAPGSLEILGVHTVLGRSLLEEDFQPASAPVALIGQSLWRSRFGSDPDIIGRSFRARRSNLAEPMEIFLIVGVLTDQFHYARDYARGEMEFVVPLWFPWHAYMIRLREGVSVAAAEQRITEAVQGAASSLPSNWSGIRLESVHDRYVATLRPVLVAIMATAALVLIIVCLNIVVLTLLRALRREKDVAVCVALGASKRHIVQLLIAETGLVCGAAVVSGLGLTALVLRLLAPLIEARLGRAAPGGTSAISLDWTVVLALGGVGVLIVLLLSFIPLLTPWQRRLAASLRSAGRSATDGRRMRTLRSSLIGLEVAASLALLVGCGLMVRSVANLVRTDLGFRTDGLMRARVALPDRTYDDAPAFLRFYDRLIEQLSAGTSSPLALSNFIPFYPTPRQLVEVDGASRTGLSAGVLAVTDGYFDMFGISMLQGRAFSALDRDGTEPVAVISETLAQRLWPDGNAVGQRIRTADQPVPDSPLTVWRSVIGVANDVRQTHTDTNLDDIYIPFLQAPSRYAPIYFAADADMSKQLATVRAVVAEIDPEVLISANITGNASLKREAEQLLAGPKFLMWILICFATFAALLALLGIYGVTAYAVQQREREVAIRIAIGASQRNVIALFLKEAGVVVASGIGVGLFGGAAVARILENQIHGVRPFDVPTFIVTCTLLTITGLLAIWWPARRAAYVSPVAVLNET